MPLNELKIPYNFKNHFVTLSIPEYFATLVKRLRKYSLLFNPLNLTGSVGYGRQLPLSADYYCIIALSRVAVKMDSWLSGYNTPSPYSHSFSASAAPRC